MRRLFVRAFCRIDRKYVVMNLNNRENWRPPFGVGYRKPDIPLPAGGPQNQLPKAAITLMRYSAVFSNSVTPRYLCIVTSLWLRD
jgi:hypothetical protein